jgi:prepilin-type N-terminal cleavage/methylation domain-containing protein
MKAIHRQAGMTLIELMVALAIGAFLMIGAVTVFMQSRTTFRVTESVSRLQENARFALDFMEPDIRMAGFWGLTTRGYNIMGRGGPADANGVGPDNCGNNWTIDLEIPVEGTNNDYAWACPGTDPVDGTSDTLIVRRAAEDPIAVAALTANTVYIQSYRSAPSQLFVGAAVPAGFGTATNQLHRLLVNGYYVSETSSIDGVPSLRRQTLADGGVMQDLEVLPSVEDMQIQFGVDTNVPGDDNRGSIDRYVNPDDPIFDPVDPAFLPEAVILAVRVWLRLRAEREENGFTDTTNYVYADQDVGPFGDGFRRIIVSKTIYLRNARPPS